MNDKALTNAELELTQKFQTHFPRGKVNPVQMTRWIGCKADLVSQVLESVLAESPESWEAKFRQWGATLSPSAGPTKTIKGELNPEPEIGQQESAIIPLDPLPVPSDASDAERWKLGWINFYRKFMGIDVSAELEQFAWPTERPKGFNWFVFCPKGLTTQMAIDLLCKPQFTTNVYIDVDKYTLDRTPDQATLVLCRETVEPDKQWLNKSGDDLTDTGKLFLDLRERIVLEAVYFFTTKKHLDIDGLTRCPGSRYGAFVAYASWDSDGFSVGSDDRRRRCPGNGGREVVVLSLKTSS